MKRSKILLVVLFIITAALGAAAIFIGYRLSQEEDVTPDEGDAATTSKTYYCADPLSMQEVEGDFGSRICNENDCSLYALQPRFIRPGDGGKSSCVRAQSDRINDDGNVTEAYVYWWGPDPVAQECVDEGQHVPPGPWLRCSSGYANLNSLDWSSCGSCTALNVANVDYSAGTIEVEAKAWSAFPYIKRETQQDNGLCEGRSCMNIEGADGGIKSGLTESAMDFRIEVKDNSGSQVGLKVIDLPNGRSDSGVLSYSCIPNNPNNIHWWSQGDRGGNDKQYECTVKYRFNNLNLVEGNQYTVRAYARINGQKPGGGNFDWREPDAVCSDYGDVNTYSWCNSSHTPSCVKTLQQASFSCDDLTADPQVITTEGGDINLTTSVTEGGVTADRFVYGTTIGNVHGENRTGSWTIPSGVAEGTYYAWVNVVASDGQQSGCTNRDTCTDDGQQCQVSVTVSDGEEPVYDIDKTAEVECVEDPNPPDGYSVRYLEAIVTYTIRVRNISNVAGGIQYVEDTYDSDYQSSWISYVEGYEPDSHNGNVIRWDNGGAGYDLAANDGQEGGDDELVFQFRVTVPEEYLGEFDSSGNYVPYEYENLVLAITRENQELRDEADIRITCAPSTGVFDSALTAGLVAILLILLGIVSFRYHDQIVIAGNFATQFKPVAFSARFLHKLGNEIKERLMYTRKERFERKIRNEKKEE